MWFYARQNENPLGPYSDDDIRKMVNDGVITPQHQLFHHGSNTWMNISQAGFAPPTQIQSRGIGHTAVCRCMKYDENALVAVTMKKREISCLGWLGYGFLCIISFGLFVIWIVIDWMIKPETPHCMRCGSWLPQGQLR